MSGGKEKVLYLNRAWDQTLGAPCTFEVIKALKPLSDIIYTFIQQALFIPS